MAKIAQALFELGITDYIVRGQPTDSDQFLSMFKKVIGTDSSGTSIESSDPSLFDVTWTQVSSKLIDIDNNAALNELREQRNNRLFETDYLALSDNTLSSSMKTYRQSLRDMPSSNNGKNVTLASDDITLENITWPTKPTS